MQACLTCSAVTESLYTFFHFCETQTRFSFTANLRTRLADLALIKSCIDASTEHILILYGFIFQAPFPL